MENSRRGAGREGGGIEESERVREGERGRDGRGRHGRMRGDIAEREVYRLLMKGKLAEV